MSASIARPSSRRWSWRAALWRPGDIMRTRCTAYWWIRATLGAPEESRLARWYERMLVWDLMNGPTLLGAVERLLDPLLGKSVAIYFDRPTEACVGTDLGAAAR